MAKILTSYFVLNFIRFEVKEFYNVTALKSTATFLLQYLISEQKFLLACCVITTVVGLKNGPLLVLSWIPLEFSSVAL